MNVLITLPKELIEQLLCGHKKFEMRKSFPTNLKLGSDGFFVVEKGTHNIRCWCKVDFVMIRNIGPIEAQNLSWDLCVSAEFIRDYARDGKPVLLWGIGCVIELNGLTTKDLGIKTNPQSFVYCPWSLNDIKELLSK